MGTVMKISIAIDEFIGNTIKYAFEGTKECDIIISFEIDQDRLVMTIEDDGIEFDPFGRNPPDTELGLQEREIGGLGIHITKKLMDEYSYSRSNGVNKTILIKNNIQN